MPRKTWPTERPGAAEAAARVAIPGARTAKRSRQNAGQCLDKRTIADNLSDSKSPRAPCDTGLPGETSRKDARASRVLEKTWPTRDTTLLPARHSRSPGLGVGGRDGHSFYGCGSGATFGGTLRGDACSRWHPLSGACAPPTLPHHSRSNKGSIAGKARASQDAPSECVIMRAKSAQAKAGSRRMRYSHQKVLLGLVVLFLTTASSSCHFNQKVTPIKESQADRLNGLFNRSRTVLTSRKKDGEVRIPFTLRDKIIYLKMIWAGRPVEAILDTGSEFVEWPSPLHLAGARTGIPQDGKIAANINTKGEWTVLSSIKAGDCEWQDIPTVASGEMKRNGPSKTMASPKPLLGAPAFHGTVLTIDYQKREIIIRAASYDVTHLPHHPHDLLLTPEWEDGYLPILKGVLSNHPARFALDSGCEGIAIGTRFVRQAPASSFAKATTGNINGVQVSTQCLKQISGTVAGTHFQAIHAEVIDLPGDFDALVGTDFPRRSRVTIDYARRKVLLEPYPTRGQQ